MEAASQRVPLKNYGKGKSAFKGFNPKWPNTFTQISLDETSHMVTPSLERAGEWNNAMYPEGREGETSDEPH